MTGFRDGRECDPVPDGSCDLTAHVAVDALAAAVGGTVRTQREVAAVARRPRHPAALTSSPGQRPSSATSRELSAAGEAAELLDPAGLGGFSWIFRLDATLARAERFRGRRTAGEDPDELVHPGPVEVVKPQLVPPGGHHERRGQVRGTG